MGRVRGVVVSNAAVVLASECLDRTEIAFSVGDAANSSSVVIKDGSIDATTTNGFPLTFSAGVYRVCGKAARHKWTAIRLAAVDCIVGVEEVFLDSYAVPEPSLGVPT